MVKGQNGRHDAHPLVSRQNHDMPTPAGCPPQREGQRKEGTEALPRVHPLYPVGAQLGTQALGDIEGLDGLSIDFVTSLPKVSTNTYRPLEGRYGIWG